MEDCGCLMGDLVTLRITWGGGSEYLRLVRGDRNERRYVGLQGSPLVGDG